MKKFLAIALSVGVSVAAGCSRESPSFEIKPGSDVTLEKKDGVTVTGRLVEVKPEHVVVETRRGVRTEVLRSDISTFRADPTPTAPVTTASTAPVTTASTAPAEKLVGSSGSDAADQAPARGPERSNPRSRTGNRTPEYREVTLPAGTVLPVELTTAVGSDTSTVEDAVRGTLRRAVTVEGVQALPAGTSVSGNVTAVDRAARVKGRASIAFRFTTIDPPGDAERVSMRTDTVARLAPATKKQDAVKIGGGAAGGAIIGAIVGGGDGAAKGAAIGGAAGTGVVLSTRGREVRLAAGTPVSVRLAGPLTLRVPMNRN